MRDEKKLALQLDRAELGHAARLEKQGLQAELKRRHISKTGIINSLYFVSKISEEHEDPKEDFVLLKIKKDELIITWLNFFQAQAYFDFFGPSFPLVIEPKES